jgi:hypothetical protein
VVHKYAAALQAKLASQDFAVAINEERGWKHADAAITLPYRFLTQQNRVIDPHILGKPGNIVRAGVVHGDAHNLQSLRAIFFLQLDKPWHLDLAGTAPGGPEVEQDSLAMQV